MRLESQNQVLLLTQSVNLVILSIKGASSHWPLLLINQFLSRSHYYLQVTVANAVDGLSKIVVAEFEQ